MTTTDQASGPDRPDPAQPGPAGDDRPPPMTPADVRRIAARRQAAAQAAQATDQGPAAAARTDVEVTGDDGRAYLRTDAGELVEVPGDFTAMIKMLQSMAAFARQINQTLAAVPWDRVREAQAHIRRAFGGDPYAPGGQLREHQVALSALEAFHRVVVRDAPGIPSAAPAAPPSPAPGAGGRAGDGDGAAP